MGIRESEVDGGGQARRQKWAWSAVPRREASGRRWLPRDPEAGLVRVAGTKADGDQEGELGCNSSKLSKPGWGPSNYPRGWDLVLQAGTSFGRFQSSGVT